MHPELRRSGMFTAAFARYGWTLAGLGTGVLIWFLSRAFNLDLFERGMALLASAEHLELDELLFLIVLVSIGVAVDALRYRLRKAKRIAIQKQRIEVLKTTMRTVLDIHGNFLNQVNHFIFTAEESGLTEETLAEMKAATRRTSERLRALAEREDLPERMLFTGEAMIEVEERERPHSS